MHGQPDAGLVFAVALAAGMLGQLFARHLRIPSIVFLLGLGVLLGPDGLDWVRPRVLGEGLLTIVSLAVAVILFEGALGLEIDRLRRAGRAIQLLVSLGAAITGLGAALAAHFIMEWPWRPSLLFGTLVLVTGPTVIKPILRNVPLRRRLATVLEAEGVLIDPVGAIAAAVALEVVLAPTAGDAGFGLPGLGGRLLFGSIAGLGYGWLLGLVLRRPDWVPEGLENLVTLGAVLFLYTVCNFLFSESGILAVTLAGVVVGNMGPHAASEMRDFEERLTLALLGVLFVLLAADVRLADVAALGWPGVVTVATLMLVVRPIDVLVCTWRSGLEWREKAFLAWTGPRGIVAAAVASLAAVLMEGRMEGGVELRALVFLAIAITVVVQGGSAPIAARLLGVGAPARAGVAVLGAEDLALAFGTALAREGRAVTFIDANAEHCAEAEAQGFVAVFGNALDERVLGRARLERCAAAVGLTANDQVNSLFVREARDDFDVPASYVALARGPRGVTPRILAKQGSRLLFDAPKDVERWNVRFRHGMAEVRTFAWVGVPESAEEEPARGAGDADPFVVLAVERAGVLEPMHAEWEAREGDAARVAVYLSQEEAAVAALARLGWAHTPEPPESA